MNNLEMPRSDRIVLTGVAIGSVALSGLLAYGTVTVSQGDRSPEGRLSSADCHSATFIPGEDTVSRLLEELEENPKISNRKINEFDDVYRLAADIDMGFVDAENKANLFESTVSSVVQEYCVDYNDLLLGPTSYQYIHESNSLVGY